MHFSNTFIQVTILAFFSASTSSAISLRGVENEEAYIPQQRQLSLFGPTERTNTLKFRISCASDYVYQVTQFDCATVSYDITNGQPWNDNNVNCYVQDGQYGIIEIRAGRHASDGPANYFNDGLTEHNMITDSNQAFDGTPEQLNFAATLNITLAYTNLSDGCDVTYKGTNVRVGQGHNSNSRNNWWIGGESMTQTSTTYGIDGVEDSNKPTSTCSTPILGERAEVAFIPLGVTDFLAYSCY